MIGPLNQYVTCTIYIHVMIGPLNEYVTCTIYIHIILGPLNEYVRVMAKVKVCTESQTDRHTGQKLDRRCEDMLSVKFQKKKSAYFCLALDQRLARSGKKTTTKLVGDHEYFMHTNFHPNPLRRSKKCEKFKGQCMITIGLWCLPSFVSKNP